MQLPAKVRQNQREDLLDVRRHSHCQSADLLVRSEADKVKSERDGTVRCQDTADDCVDIALK